MLQYLSFFVNMVGGLAFILVGALLVALRPARPGALGFALFALASGGQHLFGNLGAAFPDASWGPLLARMRLPFQMVAPIALVWGVARLRGVSTAWTIPFVVAGIAGAGALLFAPGSVVSPAAFYRPVGDVLVLMPYFLGITLAVALLAARLRAEPSIALRQELELLLLATAPPLGYTAAFSLMILWFSPVVFAPVVWWGYTVTFLACVGATFYAAWALARADGRLGRWLAAVSAALTFIGGLHSYMVWEWAQFSGVLRILAALAFGYALLKFRVFDIDLRLRTALARTLVAGLGVAAFFLASEIAEGLVADRTGSALAGLAAAALFLILETRVVHAGRRLAKRVLPAVVDSPDYLDGRKHAVYRAAVESAGRDGAVTEPERRVLAALARELGLTSEDATRIERAVRS